MPIYIVSKLTGDGIEKLSDPMPRRIYRPGEEIELDPKVSDIEGMLGSGFIIPKPEDKSEEKPEEVND